jgi:unsaturated rhamnogalacturonyl hydrolase
MLAPARKAWQALTGELTPDGYLANTAQNNKGGEELQRGGYRVISPHAIGLLAQLSAALDN